MLSGIESREELLVIISNLTSKNEEQKEIIHRLETEEKLTRFLEDGRIELSNNLAERW